MRPFPQEITENGRAGGGGEYHRFAAIKAIPCLPRDAMLARYMQSSCVGLFVRPIQACIVSKRLDGPSSFATKATFHLSYTGL